MVGIVLVLTAGVTGYLSQHVRACTLPNHARLPSSRAIVPPRLAAAKATEKEVPMPMSTMDRDGTSFSTGTPGPLVLDGTTKLQLGVLLSCSLLIQMGVGMIIVALPMYASGLGLGAGGVGLIIALPQLTKLLFNLPLGYFIDVVGRKPALVLGSLLDAIGQYGTAVASGLRQLALPRLLIGVGSASSACATQAYTLDVVGKFPQHSGLLLGLIQAVGFLAFALGPELGGRLLRRYGDPTMPFKVLAAVLLLTTPLKMLLPETRGGGGNVGVVGAVGGIQSEYGLQTAKGVGLVGSMKGAIASYRALLADRRQVALLAMKLSFFCGLSLILTIVRPPTECH